MRAFILSRNSLTLLRRAALVAVVFASGLVANTVRAEEQQQHFLSDDVVEQLAKLDEMQKDKQWDQMIALLESLYAKAQPESYDAAMLLQYMGNVYLIKNDLNSALAPLEKGLSLSERFNYYKTETEQQVRFYAAQIYYQNGMAKGLPRDEEIADLKRSEQYLVKWFAVNTRVNPEARVFYASVLFQLSQILAPGPNKADPEYLKKTEDAIHAGFIETVHPKETLYLIYINCLQLQDRYEEAANYWEILLRVQPNKKEYWSQLLATYNQLGQQSNQKLAFQYSIRTLLTLDRAQSHGFLNGPKDNFIRFSLLYNIQLYQQAALVLRTGLEDGSIEDTPKNWEILAYAYQQVNRPDDAIVVLKEAFKRYPDNGQFLFAIAQNYYTKDDSKSAYDYACQAIEVGHLEKPYAVESFIAYIAFDLRKFDEGVEAVDRALSYPESAKDTRLKGLKSAMQDEIRRREQNKKAIDAQRKSL